MRWIGLTGRMGSGKDFTYSRIAQLADVDHDPVQFRVFRASFADGLRNEIEETLGAELNVLWTKPYPEEIRRLLQWWGTDLRRSEDPDYWVKVGIQSAKAAQYGVFAEAVPVFTDVRFPNEADAIRKEGGIIVRVMAPFDLRVERLGQHPPNHASETAMDGYLPDMVVDSVEDDEAYYESVCKVMERAEIPRRDEVTTK